MAQVLESVGKNAAVAKIEWATSYNRIAVQKDDIQLQEFYGARICKPFKVSRS
jgi:hypothetical protein